VRIPLDYYQILGIPESNLSELEQAYEDRLHQLPRQGYSDAAIDSRKQLISFAYQVLSDPQRRATYESAQTPQTLGSSLKLVVSNADPAPVRQSPDLEIDPEHFLGGLLILFEQGKYEEINSICMSYIGNNGRSSNSGSLHPLAPVESSDNLASAQNNSIDPFAQARISRTASSGNVIPLKPDIVLTMVFSLLEMGEQEWKQANYEVAGSHLDAARKILVQEDLFPHIQGQIERRLGRLRPYRIAYLVSLPLDRHEQRLQGIQFLEELLETACKSELDCQERFGLNGERTIQFIHETLPHLTAGEQGNLFSYLARDSHGLELVTGDLVVPSSGKVQDLQLDALAYPPAQPRLRQQEKRNIGSPLMNSLNVMQLACTYLHVYALIAQGFAYRNPKLIYRSQQILRHRLSFRHNVTIEKAICALLLGQTEEAERLLSEIPDSPTLIGIRQRSQGLPNLMRGLCWHVESWLKGEVFPCFRDLETNDPSLEAYFDNPDVQDFLEHLPIDPQSIASWATSSPQLIDVPISGNLSGASNPDPLEQRFNRRAMINDPESNLQRRGSANESNPESIDLTPDPPMVGGIRSNLNVAWQAPQGEISSNNLPTAERVFQTTSLPPIPSTAATQAASTTDETTGNVIQLEPERRRRRPTNPMIRTIDGQIDNLYIDANSTVIPNYPMAEIKLPTTSQLVPAGKSGRLTGRNIATGTLARRRRRRSLNIPRFLMVMTGGIGALWGAIWLGNTAMEQFRTANVALPTPGAKAPDPVKTNVVEAPKQTPKQETQPAQIPKEAVAVAGAGVLTADVATQIVQTWLNAKAQSLGKEHQTSGLKDILVEPALSRAVKRTESEKADGIYGQYKHTAVVPSIPQVDANAQVATIQAQVQEEAEYYANGVLKPDRSYSKKILVNYDLVRQKDRWYVKDMQVIR
jgi:curved DNA-binding protein CbpA